jgi:predicted nucleic acid-binding protein
MTYLLDVNALVALGFLQHEFHDRVVAWMRSQPSLKFATCSITELGFVRVLAQVSAYGLTVAQARTLLTRMKQVSSPAFVFITDDHDVAQLPGWVKTPKQTTDGHLAKLATSNGAVLATVDARTPGAYLIP